MDRKTLLILAACFALMLGWGQLVKHFYPDKTIEESTNTVAEVTNYSGSTNGSALGRTGSNSTAGSFPGAVTPESRPLVTSSAPEETVVVTNADARYTFTSYGGGLKLVELTHYAETIDPARQGASAGNDFATLNLGAKLPVLAVVGDSRLEGDGIFKLSRTAGGVRAEKALPGGLTLVKNFELSSNYLVTADVQFINTTTNLVNVPAQQWVVGTATPMNLRLEHGLVEYGKSVPSTYYVNTVWWNGDKSDSLNVSYFNTNTTSWLFFSRTVMEKYNAGSNNVNWVSMQNQYFTLAAMPKNPAESMSVTMINLPTVPRDNGKPAPAIPGLQTTVRYPALALKAGQTADLQWTLYAGPKEYDTLAKVGSRFGGGVDSIMGFSGIWIIAKWMLWAMNGMHHALNLGYGWLIVVLTVVIRLFFWPLTRMSTRSMKRMQELAPQMKAMQEKYKDDPAKLSQKQLEFWKKNKVNPLGGCLPMLLQIPIFMGYYRMLSSAIELRGAEFLWAHDLSRPDTIFYIPGLDFPVNPLPLIMGATLLWQTHVQPPSPGMDPGQQKMMKFMPLMMMFFLYYYSSGLALYMTVSNLLTILQTKLTKTKPATADSTPAATAAAVPRKK